MRRDSLSDRICGNAINIFCYLFLCFWIGLWTIAGGATLGGKWGHSLNMFLEQMSHSTVASATISLLWIIFECLVCTFGIVMFSALFAIGVMLLADGWPFDDYEEPSITKRINYALLPLFLVIVGTVATIVSIWKSAWWDLNNKELILTCLVSLTPIAVCAWCLFFMCMGIKDK